MVADVAETVAWYERTLGAEAVDEVPDDEGDPVWARVAVDDVDLMFQRRDSLEAELPALSGTEIGASGTFYVDVDDVDSLSEKLSDVPRALEMRTTEYGRREFAIEDPNGYVLWFSSSTTE